MVCYCRLIFYFVVCFVLPAQAMLLPDAVLEETVFNLGADEAENRELAYDKIFANPKAYLKFLTIASASDDLELQKKAQELLFFAQLGFDASIRREIFDAAATLRGLKKNQATRIIRNMLEQYIQDGSLSLEECHVVIKLTKSRYFEGAQWLLDRLIATQVLQAFTSALQKGEDPSIYMMRLFFPPTSLSFQFNEVVGRLHALNLSFSQPLSLHDSLAAWERLIRDPLLYEGYIRGSNPSVRVSRILDLALHRTDQLQRLFTELGETGSNGYRIVYGQGWFDALRFTYDWMKQNQEGKSPSRSEYADKIILANMKSESRGSYVGAALAAIGCVPDRELVRKLGASAEDMELYYKKVGILSSEDARKGVEASLERLKAKPSQQAKEISFFYGMLAQLEDKGEYECVQKACLEFLACVDSTAITASLGLGERHTRYTYDPAIHRCPLLLQCAIVNQYKELAQDLAPQDKQGREMLGRLFASLPVSECHHLFLLTQRHLANWEEFLDEKLEILFAQAKQEDQQYVDDLYHLSQLLYKVGWEKQALKVALFSPSASQGSYPLTLYRTVLLLIEQGNLVQAEEFFHRYSPDAYAKSSSYWLAKAEIATAKKEPEKALTYLGYAQSINVLDVVLERLPDGETVDFFVSHLVRGSHLEAAEKSQRFDDEHFPSLIKMAQAYMKRGDWYTARFFFEYYLHSVVLRCPTILESTIYGVRTQSELAQALYYMGEGEPARAKPHLDLCFELMLDQPELAEEVFSALCGPLALASIEQKQEWLDQGIASLQELYTKMPKHYFYAHAIQFMKGLKPQNATVKVVKRFEHSHLELPHGEMRIWPHREGKIEGEICLRDDFSIEVKRRHTGDIITINLGDLSEEDKAYVSAWDRYRVLKEDYAASCAQHPNQLVWLEDAARAQQLSRVLAKPLLIVALPVKNSAAYKELYPVLMSGKMQTLVGDKAICTLLQPEADGTWSPGNEAFIRGYGGGQGDLSTKVPAFFFEKGVNHLATMFPDKEKLEGDLLKFTEQNFLPKDKVIKFVD